MGTNAPRHDREPGEKWLSPKRLRLLLLAAGAFLVLLTVLLLVWLLPAGEDAPEDASPSPRPTADRGVFVEDIYEGPRYVPRFDFPENTLDPELFFEEDGFLRYGDGPQEVGVDVSEFQGEIDWKAAKAAGLDFCILRVGYRGTTAGLLNEDAAFAKNLAGAEAAGLKIGVYFFSQAVSEAEARKEADFVIERLKGHEIAYPVVFDWEPPAPGGGLNEEDLRANSVSGWQVTNFAKAFCERVKKAGYIPCVYSNKTMAYEFFDLSALKDFDFWYAEYQPAPSLYYGFRLWQYTSDGEVAGIPGTVDMDLCFTPYD